MTEQTSFFFKDVNETWSGILIGLSLEEKVDLSSDIYCALLPKVRTSEKIRCICNLMYLHVAKRNNAGEKS